MYGAMKYPPSHARAFGKSGRAFEKSPEPNRVKVAQIPDSERWHYFN
jgi:hypothetical protein